MNKKIFDIIPPGESTVKETQPAEKKKASSDFNWRSGGLVLVVVLGVAAVLYQVFGTDFTLFLEPKTEIANLEVEFRVWSEEDEINFQDNILPGQMVVREKGESRVFLSSGSRTEEELARGTIRVYNAVSPPREINLRATTRFLSSGGEYFRAPNAIRLPPATMQGGRLVASETDVPVEAMDPGPAFNIAPTKFSVPGLMGTDLYDKIHGESFEPMIGGSVDQMPEVTQADIRGAEEKLRFDLVDGLVAELEEENPDQIILPEAIATEITLSEPSVEPGGLKEDFDYRLNLKGRALVFSKEDLDALLSRTVEEEIGSEHRIVPDSLYLDYRVLSFNVEDELIRINLKFSAEVYRDLGHQEWPEMLSGLSRGEVREKMLDNDRLKAFQFRLAPFWLRRVPQAEKVNVSLRFE